MIANIAIKYPELNRDKTNLELLFEQIPKDSPLGQHLNPVIRATERGANLTHRLLAFARRQPLNVRAVDVEKLIHDMDDILQSSLGESIDTSIVSEPGLWRCKVDPAQLERAILKLAVNGRDAMPEGGHLTFELSNGRIDDELASQLLDVSAGEYVMLTVSDTGKGMTPDVAEQVFEPFFTTKKVGEGTGLGLSMVFGLMKQSAGHITVSSDLGKGPHSGFTCPSPRPRKARRMPIPSQQYPRQNPARSCWWWKTTGTCGIWPSTCCGDLTMMS